MVELDPPEARTCERCGRTEVWSDEQGTWVAADPSDGGTLGTPHCVHDWDISGNYRPVTH